MRNALLAIAALIVLGATGVAGGYISQWWEGDEKPPRPVVIDTLTSNRTLPQPEPIAWPEEVTLYAPVETTAVETVRVAVPMDLSVEGVIGENPIRRIDRWWGRDQLALRYFDPAERRYVQERFRTPTAKWKIWVDAGVEATAPLIPARRTLRLNTDLKAWLRYRRLRGYVGAGLRGTRPVGMVGIRTRILSYSWN